MTDNNTPDYDKRHPIIQDRINEIVELWQIVHGQPSRDFPSDNDLKELYAKMPNEDLYDKWVHLKQQATDMKLTEHRLAYGR